ncbi:hypothetical protein [Bradyrhizobium sp. HKCCYLRH1030]|uniref:hypothetical protein n=1 Tax=Bradyrhizobium sp. HKCCYLRH1030 TaxID=3420744 RepID=UPI003EB8CDE4
MKTKPLTLVTASGAVPEPPAPLGSHGKRLWTTVLSEYQIDDGPSLELSRLGCAALDRAEDCAEAIKREGLMIGHRRRFFARSSVVAIRNPEPSVRCQGSGPAWPRP